MTQNMVDSLLALSNGSNNGNTIELSESSQGELPRKKEEVGRLQRRIRTFKGNFIFYMKMYSTIHIIQW